MTSQLITNPFEQINLRFNTIENLLLQLHAKDSSKQPPPVDQDIIEIDEATELIKYSKPAIYAYCKRGEMPCIRKGRKILFSKKALHEWLQEGRKITLSEIQRNSQRPDQFSTNGGNMQPIQEIEPDKAKFPQTTPK